MATQRFRAGAVVKVKASGAGPVTVAPSRGVAMVPIAPGIRDARSLADAALVTIADADAVDVTDGVLQAMDPEDLPNPAETRTYDGSGNLLTRTLVQDGVSYVKTYTLNGAGLPTAISAWVAV